MNTSAKAARLTLAVGGRRFPVLGLAGRESFNQPFIFTIEILAPDQRLLTRLLETDALLAMTAPDGLSRQIRGIVIEVGHLMDIPDGRSLWKIEIASTLIRMVLRTDCRLILDRSLPEIIEETLGRNDIAKSAIGFRWKREHPIRPTTLQAGENDFNFIARLCSRAGIIFWSEAGEEEEIIHFVDASLSCLPLAREPLVYRPDSGLMKTRTTNDILSLRDEAHLTTTFQVVQDVWEQAPEQSIVAERQLPGAGGGSMVTRAVGFGSGVTNLDEAENEAKLRAVADMVVSSFHTATTHAVDLRPGRVVRIEAENFAAGTSGDYLIAEVRHQSRQYAGFGLGGDDDAPYTAQAVLVPRTSPYWVHPVRVPTLPLTFTARIESRELTANLDDGGRTRFRQHSDSEDKAYGANSIPVRRLQPYGGPGIDRHQPGWHMPLQDGAEILLACLNNDPDRLMIVGSLPNPENLSPVTAENASQNRIRTAADHEVVFQDLSGEPLITMRTFNGHNMLVLDGAKVENRIRLATEQGVAELFAKRTIHTESGDNCEERVGNDRLLVVEDAHRTATNTAEIHHQAATDTLLRAGRQLELEAGENIELECAEDCIIDITEKTTITVEGEDAAIEIDSGRMTIQADGGILIEGDGGGDIFFGQNGAGIKIDPEGNITLFGDEVTFDTPGGVGLFGKVNIEIGDPPEVPMPGGVAVDEVIGIEKLQAQDTTEEEPPHATAVRINLHDVLTNEEGTGGTASRFDGSSYILETDTGEVFEGTVQDGEIVLENFDIHQKFRLTVDGFVFMKQTNHGGEE